MLIHPISMYARAGGGFTALLDESGVPSAYMAFGVRKLRSAYAGSCIRIREDGGDTETDIGFSGEDIDESAIKSHCGVNNGYVVTIYDQSGNGYNITLSTASQQWQVCNGGTLLKENGKLVLDQTRNGSPAGVGFKTTPSTAFTPSGGAGVSAVIIPVANAITNDRIVSLKLTGATFDYSSSNELIPLFLDAGTTSVETFADGAGRSPTTLTNGNQYHVVMEHDGTDITNYVNNSAASSYTHSEGLGSSYDVVAIGDHTMASGNTPFNGKFQEVVLWESDPTSAVTTIESNTNTYYSIY